MDTTAFPPSSGATGPAGNGPGNTGNGPGISSDGPGPGTGPTNQPFSDSERFFERIRNLGVLREGQGRWLAGVCAGVARRFDVDPILVRAIVVVLGFIGGLGFGLYLLAWALLPDEDGEILLEGSTHRGRGAGIALVVVGTIALIDSAVPFPNHRGWSGLWLPVALVLGFIAFRSMRKEARNGGTARRGPAETTSDSTFFGAPTGVPVTGGYAPAPGRVGPTTVPPAESGLGQPARVARPARAPRAPRPPRPPRQRRRSSGGPALFLVTLGLAAMAYGGAWLLASTYSWTGDAYVYGMSAALATMGVVFVVKGVLGMRVGGSMVLAAPLALALATVAALPSGVEIRGGAGERLWTPTAATVQSGYDLGVGSAVLDLTQLAVDPAHPRSIDVQVGVGELTIRTPATGTTRIDSTVLVGSRCDGNDRNCDEGRNLTRTEVTNPGTGGDTPALSVHAKVSLGTIVVRKGN